MGRTMAALLASALAGCAGSPIGIATHAGARDVTVDGKVYAVSPMGSGAWGAVPRDIYGSGFITPPSENLPRKIAMTRAVEIATGCRVVDSVFAPPTLHAQVDCGQKPAAQ